MQAMNVHSGSFHAAFQLQIVLVHVQNLKTKTVNTREPSTSVLPRFELLI